MTGRHSTLLDYSVEKEARVGSCDFGASAFFRALRRLNDSEIPPSKPRSMVLCLLCSATIPYYNNLIGHKFPHSLLFVAGLVREEHYPIGTLNELEKSRLENAISPRQIPRLNKEQLADFFLRDLAGINEFYFYVEAEPFLTPEKAENQYRVAFKNLTPA